MIQQELFFDGADYVHERDFKRLRKQLNAVFQLMKDGQWRTLNEIADATNYPHASVSACLRDLRKERWGAYIVDREYLGNGLYTYRVIVPKDIKDEL
jgi:DNA-binding Lrp family transcriptional regulator